MALPADIDSALAFADLEARVAEAAAEVTKAERIAANLSRAHSEALGARNRARHATAVDAAAVVSQIVIDTGGRSLETFLGTAEGAEEVLRRFEAQGLVIVNAELWRGLLGWIAAQRRQNGAEPVEPLNGEGL